MWTLIPTDWFPCYKCLCSDTWSGPLVLLLSQGRFQSFPHHAVPPVLSDLSLCLQFASGHGYLCQYTSFYWYYLSQIFRCRNTVQKYKLSSKLIGIEFSAILMVLLPDNRNIVKMWTQHGKRSKLNYNISIYKCRIFAFLLCRHVSWKFLHTMRILPIIFCWNDM